ncbi:hypothetical protein GUJ93_ZPchr0008g14120 [Zizania palustris]|uniref:Uncharacterized protein n=1 Tax=Zizania palustris TaxID=103762 RepID=A0A8J5RJW1_ZIZPA|nr:hypothetical protein GUJ93_ZPchr0008g14120 [Zizania palustris]
MGLSRFSHWIWPGSRTRRAREAPVSNLAMADALFPDSPSGFREPDVMRVPSSGGDDARRRKGTNRRCGREEARVDREHDMVIVPSDGGGYFSDSDDSDWSIGWLEPLGPDLHSDGSFAVLVPCYRHGRVDEPGLPAVRLPDRGRLVDGNVSGELIIQYHIVPYNKLLLTQTPV